MGIISIFLSGRVQKLEQRIEKLQIMDPSYIHTEKALSALFPAMPLQKKMHVTLKCLASHLYKESFTFHTILQAHSIEVRGATFRENTI